MIDLGFVFWQQHDLKVDELFPELFAASTATATSIATAATKPSTATNDDAGNDNIIQSYYLVAAACPWNPFLVITVCVPLLFID